jgi:hypothetical protein
VIGNSGGKKLCLRLRRSTALKRDLRTSAFIRAGALLRRYGPVPGILAARRPGALMHKSRPRFLSSTDSCCNPCLGHHCYLCLGQCVTHVLAICVTYVLAPHRSLAPPDCAMRRKHERPHLLSSICYLSLPGSGRPRPTKFRPIGLATCRAVGLAKAEARQRSTGSHRFRSRRSRR